MSETKADTGIEYPVMFLSHAAPVLFMDDSPMFAGIRNDAGVGSNIHKWYQNLPKQLGMVGKNKPKAIVCISAHWITPNVIKITAQDKHPGLLYDYYGFPGHLYDIEYPSPGSVELASRIQSLLTEAGVPAELDKKRNIDHAAFIPLKLMYPEADIPLLQISLLSSMDPKVTVKVGEALRSLRKEGILILGSGQTSHNAFHLFGNKQARAQTEVFVDALTQGLFLDDANDDEVYNKRVGTMINWKKLPQAGFSHPSDDHFAPLMSVVGATHRGDQGHIVGDHWMMGLHSLRTFVFGDYKQLQE